MASVTIEPMPMPLHVDETGTIRVGGTRLLLDLVMGAFNDGASPEGIVFRYPVVSVADVYATIAYYLSHQAELDAYLAEREAEGRRWREFWEARIPAEVKQRLRNHIAQREFADSGHTYPL